MFMESWILRVSCKDSEAQVFMIPRKDKKNEFIAYIYILSNNI